jgi:DNA-binding transcriptional LysR family regulator
VYVNWGPTFYAQHSKVYPDLERPAQMANIGWLGLQLILANGGTCFVPERVAAPYVRAGCLHVAPTGPRFLLPAYVVYPLESESPVLETALSTLRAVIEERSPADGGTPTECTPEPVVASYGDLGEPFGASPSPEKRLPM